MSEQEKMGIDETMEGLEFAEKLISDLADQKDDDGELTALEYIQVAIADAPLAFKAAHGAGKILPELKDLDADESGQIAEKGLAISQAIMRLMGSDK